MRLPDDHPFFRVPTSPFETSAGPVQLPILYFDVTSVTALFRVPRAPVEALLAGSGLELGLTLGGDALVAVAFYAYRRTTIGPYNEVGTATFVRRPGDRPPRVPWVDLYRDPDRRTIGAHILDLPVTTAIACAGGREVWGYPKFVAPISVDLGRGAFAGAVQDPAGGELVSLSGRLGAWVPSPPMGLTLYSHRAGALLRTSVHVRGAVRTHRGAGLVLRVGPSRHPMADRLRRLGLDGARPTVVLATEAFQSRLHRGVAVGAGTADSPPAPRQAS